MATNKLLGLVFILASGAAWSREVASVPACQAAAAKPAIAGAKAAVDRAPSDLTANFGLADAWSDAGCYGEAVQVLQAAQGTHAGNQELETRLRVARSLVGEEHYFDTLDRADTEAKLKRDTFRCNTMADLEACSEAVRVKPDDAALLTAQADALMHAKRPSEALAHYRRAATLAPSSELSAKLSAAEAQVPGGRATSGNAEEPSGGARLAGGGAPASAPTKPQKPIRVARVDSTPAPAPATAAPATRRYSNDPKGERSH